MLKKIVLLLVAICCAAEVGARRSGGMDPTAIEQAQLPKYCYAQYVDEKLAGDPRYSIQGCGVTMNHFCPGLLHLMRAQKVSDSRGARAGELGSAIENFKYTLKAMPPGCWLRPDAEAALARAKIMERFLK